MSECVVRMKKPKSCEECDIATKYQRFGTEICCPFMGWYADYNKCPIFLQLPEEHGRLVDVKEVIRYGEREVIDADKFPHLQTIRYVVDTKYLDDVQTIVPATERSEA